MHNILFFYTYQRNQKTFRLCHY